MVRSFVSTALCVAGLMPSAAAYAFVPGQKTVQTSWPNAVASKKPNTRTASTSLSMIDQNVIMGGGIAVAGVVAGIGMVAFAESMGERGMERGSGLSENMSTQLAGSLMEDVEVSSVQDLGSLTSQLEAALKETGGTDEKELEMTEEEKKRIAEEADDGW
mmetsp:Transcript_27596/g.81160  ORF Transcript_27596/g.81160 Transcript_27596/m.81160 type:complete len:160 (-) Transcript_27596:324-803(-)|eukprot:CAMPEP_0113560974 /NCGR_PEP_ID=MMETSP0015_2-20120614/19729_1 /TAXON_ID=2838 /ORGANISM="Odontella" /LENGTH=159 /DNA_ID=CAMNT_0000462739 /DNA_START=166 /DNA_END=645 /DNA_ORIENTATION=- /assembly_acc=CAM_ASM_000160